MKCKRNRPARGHGFCGNDVVALMQMTDTEGIAELTARGYPRPAADVALGMWVLLERDRDKRMVREARLRAWLRRWATTPPVSTEMNVAMWRLAKEIGAALRGEAPPRKRGGGA